MLETAHWLRSIFGRENVHGKFEEPDSIVSKNLPGQNRNVLMQQNIVVVLG